MGQLLRHGMNTRHRFVGDSSNSPLELIHKVIRGGWIIVAKREAWLEITTCDTP
jgi:hypothetical protein